MITTTKIIIYLLFLLMSGCAAKEKFPNILDTMPNLKDK